MRLREKACVCVCMCMRACVRVCACMHVCNTRVYRRAHYKGKIALMAQTKQNKTVETKAALCQRKPATTRRLKLQIQLITFNLMHNSHENIASHSSASFGPTQRENKMPRGAT